MLDQILASFAGSSDASALASKLLAEGLSPEKATEAVAATVEGAQGALGTAGPAALLGMLGGSGGGALGALGGLFGGGAPSPTPSNPLADQIAAFVAAKVGIDVSTAKRVVDVVLPKLLELVKAKGAGGLLG